MSDSRNQHRPRTRAGKADTDDRAGRIPSQQQDADPRPTKPPKRVRFGLKLKSAEEPTGRNHVATQWLATLPAMVDAEGRQEGLEYARIGQTINMEVAPGHVTANVQGRRGKPYVVTLTFQTLDRSQWSRLIDALASEAASVAKLLAGELPERFFVMLDSFDLMREGAGEASTDRVAAKTILGMPRATCSCGYHRPCKHAAAIGFLLAERLNEDPLTLLTLLGMASEQMQEQLRQVRVVKTQGVASAHPDQFASLSRDQPLPLEACLDEFWRYGPQLSELEQSPPPHHVPHALLRRLGPPPLNGRFPMVGLLASAYDTVTKAAIELRDSAEGNIRDRE